MWNDRIRIAERVRDDWSNLSADEKALVTEAMHRLDDDPIAGVPLLDPLRGTWSYRTRWIRVLYTIAPEARAVIVTKIGRVAEES